MKKPQRDTSLVKAQSAKTQQVARHLFTEIRSLIETTRGQVAQAVNSSLVLLYWQIGKMIRTNVLGEERAEYGQQIVSTLSKQLVNEYGNGFSRRNLFNMIRFAEIFPNVKIVQTLSAQLSWSHFVEILVFEEPLKRDFYAEMCRIERWSVRMLREKISGMLYERTAISKKPVKLIKQELKSLRDEDKLTPDLVFRDPYLLNFLGLKDTYSEKGIESAILREIKSFILELGVGFSFVERQKRITVDGEDYYIDLLFYHRTLKRLVAIDLKLEKFKAADKGQMELYLRWLEKHEQVELLQLHKTGIRVAEYMTELPPRKVLEKKLHQAIIAAREQLTRRSLKPLSQ
ncbi:MAG: PDDEXK nuclease domain-containing protein [Bacteroidota bacterium]|nr:PDDEXK nuclease domain-containing protein [Bacteroidota bacterium]